MEGARIRPMTEPANQPTALRDLSDLVTAVFRAWREAGVAFLILRNYENLPQDVSNDIDVLVRPTQLAEAERVMIEAACSSMICVFKARESLSASDSSYAQPSSNASRPVFSKRPSGLIAAPRPLRASSCLPDNVRSGMCFVSSAERSDARAW